MWYFWWMNNRKLYTFLKAQLGAVVKMQVQRSKPAAILYLTVECIG